MRWWLNTDDPKIFAVDNASVSGMDFSTLPSDLWMVQWTDGKGELERQVDADTNDNGLREPFIDVIPYAPFFQQFLTKLPMLTLVQAKKVQIDLVKQIFEAKRQAPYHYPVASGDYSWDASDDALYSSAGAQIQNAIASINAIATRLNTVIPALNTNDEGFATQGNNLKNYFNDPVINSMDIYLQASSSPLGLPGSIAYTTVTFAATPVAWTALPPVTINMQWIPIGGTAPVAVTTAEQTAILNGIAVRTSDLTAKKNVKVAQVNALTTISAVIAYDVTTGW
jgi:hypothetical protein